MRRTTLQPVKVTGRKSGWKLDLPATLSPTGKRQRMFFATREDARRYAEELSPSEPAPQNITPRLALEAEDARRILEPFGVSLVDAARIVAEIRRRDSASCDLESALAAWMLNNEGLRQKTLTGYRHTAERLKKAIPGRLLSSLSAEELQQALAPPGTPAPTARGHITNARAFWNYAAESGWCKAETFATVKPPKNTAPAKEIEILTPAEAENLLRTAEKHFPAAVASYALQLFSGIRVEEITRLEAHHVTSEGVELPAEITKKGRRRHITPNATLAAWLERYPFAPCPNWKRTDRACRYMAGFDLVPDPDLVKPSMRDLERKRKPWPQNAMRHSHASYAVASGASLETLLFEFGHSGTPVMLRQHYVGRASKKDALAFFSIAPEGVEIQQVKAV